MHSHNINVYYERVRLWHWTIGLIRINTFNLRAPIFTVAYNNFPCIITVTLLNTRRNEWAEDFCYFSEVFDWYGIQKKTNIFILNYCTNKASFHNWLWGTFKPSLIIFGVGGFFGRKLQYLKPQVCLDQIFGKAIQDLFSGISLFCID